ncbi:uncharacterized protein LOC117187205 [Drosophila miranda]|uniref:uncharacterized protein LOC117187205 n=1 Tax=Drosophila miranda TaxID=7229 RepID=UPI00143F3460|nr:uncharacterized protein LOC117187205 [Drosophila miranda]
MLTPHPPKQSTSHATASGHDERGNLLWQQEASEFVEQFPTDPVRRCPVPPLRHCHAHGHGHATLGKRNADLFSGDLGIPEISTHVGSVVHTFETLALQRRLAEAEQERDRDRDRDRELSKYEPNVNANGNGTTQSKYNQLKRRSQEMRQRLMQQMHRQKLQQQARTRAQSQPQTQAQPQPQAPLTNSCSTQTLANAHLRPHRARSTEQLQHQSTFEDYRKNLFGTLTRPSSVEEELQDESFIVNAAFDEIFSRYDDDSSQEQEAGGMTLTNTDDLFEDEHMLVSLSELDDDVFASKAQTASTTPTTSAAGRTPKHSTPQLNLNKYPAPAPPRSRTLTNLFERLKSEQHQRLQKYPAESQLHQAADFNRGSTLSKSFVQQLRRPSQKQKRAAPKPPPKPKSRSHVAIAHVTPLRHALIFPKRSKSSNELLLDDLNVQARKYYRRTPELSAAL